MSILLLVVGILLFIGLVVVHEYGHFIFARRNGVDIEEFGIGFPPALYRKKIKSKKGGYDFTINALPLGGFVRLKGEHDADTDPGTFGAASLWGKTQIMAAGVLFNLITAYILFLIVALIGMPRLVDNQFTIQSDTTVTKSSLLAGYVEPGSPASKAGIVSGDRLVTIAAPKKTVQLNAETKLPDLTTQFAGQRVQLTYLHEGVERHAEATIRTEKVVQESRDTDSPKGHLGIIPTTYVTQRSTWSAPVVAGGVMVQFTGLTFQGLGKALAGLGGIIAGAVTGNTDARQAAQTEASSQVSGPVGIFVILKDGTILGYQFVLFVIAIISLTLAVMNILPIPALDGGRLWITLVARGLNRPLSARTEEIVNASGFILLMGLIVLITVVDVKRFF